MYQESVVSTIMWPFGVTQLKHVTILWIPASAETYWNVRIDVFQVLRNHCGWPGVRNCCSCRSPLKRVKNFWAPPFCPHFGGICVFDMLLVFVGSEIDHVKSDEEMRLAASVLMRTHAALVEVLVTSGPWWRTLRSSMLVYCRWFFLFSFLEKLNSTSNCVLVEWWFCGGWIRMPNVGFRLITHPLVCNEITFLFIQKNEKTKKLNRY